MIIPLKTEREYQKLILPLLFPLLSEDNLRLTSDPGDCAQKDYGDVDVHEHVEQTGHTGRSVCRTLSGVDRFHDARNQVDPDHDGDHY